MDDKLIDIAGLDHFKQSQDALNDEKYVSNALIGAIINEHLTSVYRYKGSVDSFDELPKDGNENGDVYDVAGGMNYAWNGTRWDELGDHMLEVDPALNSTSTNPVQNKAIKAELDKKAGTSVATSSNNGLMSAEDKNRLDGINDYTTGINLLRGTRDFVSGITPYLTGKNYLKDGWYWSSAKITTYKDNDGFTVLNFKQDGLAANSIIAAYGSILNCNAANEVMTVSCEFMVDDVREFTSFNTSLIRCDVFPNDGGNSKGGVNFNYGEGTGGNTNYESGKWYKWVYAFSTSLIESEDDWVLFSPRLNRNGSLNVRKLKVERGKVNNPIWSASPFDVTQEALAGDSPISNLGSVDNTHLLKSGDDLNKIIIPGIYAASSDAVAKEITNRPPQLNNGFKLKVENSLGISSNVYVKQWATYYGESSTEFIRYSQNSGSTWTDWRQTYANTTVRPIEGGGTGSSTAKGAQFNLLKDMDTSDIDTTDGSLFVQAYGENNASSTNGKLVIKPAPKVWNWIKSKIDSNLVTTSDIDKMFNGTYTVSDTPKLVDDAAVSYAIDRIKEL